MRDICLLGTQAFNPRLLLFMVYYQKAVINTLSEAQWVEVDSASFFTATVCLGKSARYKGD